MRFKYDLIKSALNLPIALKMKISGLYDDDEETEKSGSVCSLNENNICLNVKEREIGKKTMGQNVRILAT